MSSPRLVRRLRGETVLVSRIASGLVAALLALAPAVVEANPFDLYGAGTTGTSMGNAGTASIGDYSAVYYNPAALTLGGSSAGAGFLMTQSSARIRPMARPLGYSIPPLGNTGPAISSEDTVRRRRGESLGSSYGLTFGASNRLGTERFRLGVMAYVPITSAADSLSRFSDERERLFSNELSFELLGGRVNHATVFFAGAYQVTEWLSLGLGASYMVAADTRNFGYVDNITDQSDVDLNVGLGITSRVRPNAGLLLTPVDDWSFGLSFRDEQYLRLTGLTEIQVRGLQDGDDYPFYQTLDITVQYSPRTFSAGAAWSTDLLLLSADIRYYVWSSYLNNQSSNAGFRDTFSPRIGAQIQAMERHAFRFGLEWEPSPVGDTRGRMNYVDNDRIVTAIGGGHTFELGDSALVLGWNAQVHWLLEQTITKRLPSAYETCATNTRELCDEVPDDAVDPETGEVYPEAAGLQTENPGFPGWRSGGVLASVGLDLRWEF
ncbi:MAG: long-chain fatty acid transport protein [Bradymonadia bacterium]|jgi:long-chain fatty acid transport protein